MAGAFLLAWGSGAVLAQLETASPDLFEARARAADATTLVVGSDRVHLWGIEESDVMSAAFKLKVRTALDNAIGGKQVECEVRHRSSSTLYAQCVNSSDIDLGLYMIQQGYASVDRALVYGTAFEEAYIQAEMEAQDRGLGIWADPGRSGQGPSGAADGVLMLSFGFILFLCIIVAFTVLSIIIMRGFQKVVDAQNDNVEMMSKERKLRDQERGIVAIMLDSELKANKAKIEAYLVVYDELLKALKDPSRPPKYKKTGDIVQKQPALDRSVFDRNTDKLDTLGDRLSSGLIHFYARIKSKPEYENLDPNMDLPEAIALVEGVVKAARRLDKLAGDLIEAFSKQGEMLARPEDE